MSVKKKKKKHDEWVVKKKKKRKMRCESYRECIVKEREKKLERKRR